MRHDDFHLPEALVGALLALILLVAAFVSTPVSAATESARAQTITAAGK
ncbi:MAG TPA: hypothetical protein VML91_04965 [Burkholderiales bacterium]|nr:hypothetical protein [Burkholderiales bacterium]